MTAATATTQPTEQEVRAHVLRSLERSMVDAQDLIYEYVRAIAYVAPGERGPAYQGSLWDNLRPSEAERLEELLGGVWGDERTIHEIILDDVVAAAMAFAAEFPEAPRAVAS